MLSNKYSKKIIIITILIILILILLAIPIFINFKEHIINNISSYEKFSLEDDVYSIKQKLDREKIINNMLHKYDYTSDNFYQLSKNDIKNIQSSGTVVDNYNSLNNDIINLLTHILYNRCPLNLDKKDHILGKLELQHKTVKNNLDYYELIAISIKKYLELFNHIFLTKDIHSTLVVLLNNIDIGEIEIDFPNNFKKYVSVLEKINEHWFFGDGLCNRLEFVQDIVRLEYDIEKKNKNQEKIPDNILTHEYFIELNKLI